ncbi:MAG: 3-dehydroquinate synthase [Beijerinckiaceae bacterium]|nr:3-dehydroquinate synthase [Beijerinckiaceae bacterium]
MTTSAPLIEDDAVRLRDRRAAGLVDALGGRSIVLVGLMGCGKSSTGRCLARRLGLDFVDADCEIELAHRMSISEIFERHGEAYFRDGERRVMARLLAGGPKVIATGGGAFLNEQTRAQIAERGLSVWLKAELDVLWRRVRRRSHRPLLKTEDPEATLRELMEKRYPIYGRADVTLISRDGPHEAVVEEALAAIEFHLRSAPEVPLDAKPRDAHPVAAPPLAAPAAPEPGAPAHRVPVDLPGREYGIEIGPGLIETAGTRIALLAPGAACAIVTDDNVAAHHLARLQASLDRAGIRHASILVRPGESSKSYGVFQEVCDAILAAKMERGDLVIAFGGGVVGDLAGFAAASVRRGMRFVQMPTSLLAQVDSSVGGKTGINSAHGKNLIGAFHQPSLVIADSGVLGTLPPRELAAGYAEVVKWGLIGDADFFAWLEANHGEVFAGGPARDVAIAKACAGKAGVVMRDERETGERALLNLGHTFGHAFERLTHYDGTRLVHGEGVAIGLACALRFSASLGLCAQADVARVEAHLAACSMPTRIADIPGFEGTADAILDAMYQDKKVERGALTFILVRGIGQAFVAKGIAADDVRAFLEQDLKA